MTKLKTARDSSEVRDLAEVKAFEASARRADAEAAKFDAETVRTRLETESVQMDLEMRQFNYREHKTLNHTYHFASEVSDRSLGQLITTFLEWDRIVEGRQLKIELSLYSGGGSMTSGLALFDFIRDYRNKGHVVDTFALGIAASMAGVILQAGTKRYIGRESWLLIHETQFGAGGSTGQVEDTLGWVKGMQERILNIFAERSTLSPRQLAKKWKRKDWWISSTEAFKIGLVDAIR